MTLSGKLEIDVKVNAPASKVYEIMHARPYIMTNISPEKIKGCKLLKGERGKVDSIIYWNYILDGEASVAENLVEAVDEENYLVTYKVVQGDILKDYKTFKFTIQCIKKDTGSVARWNFEFETLQGEIPNSRGLFQLFVEISKDIDAHLRQGNQEPHADVAAAARA